MSLLLVQSLAKSFGADQIFDDITFRVESNDHIGLVGANGAGKTTLLTLLMGLETADHGSFTFAQGSRIGYLSQVQEFHPAHTLYETMLEVFRNVHEWEQELQHIAVQLALPDQAVSHAALLEQYARVQENIERAGGYTYEYRIDQILHGLGFEKSQYAEIVASMSGGQQTRAALARVLLESPDMLVLDEPTNHLDIDALEWLENYLSEWTGALLIVSHDRYFLDCVTTSTLELARGRVESYPGNYTRYVRLRTERLERLQKEYESQQEYIGKTEDFIRRYKAGQRSKQARGRQTLLDRMERIELPPSEHSLHVTFDPSVQPGRIVMTLKHLHAGYIQEDSTERVLVSVQEQQIERGECIGIIGPNGAGKTTLLRTLAGILEPLHGHVGLGHNVQLGYYSQTHEGLNAAHTIMDEMREHTTLKDEEIRSFMARFLFTKDDIFRTIGTLSGGERSRVALAKLAVHGANVLLLDEPTNHLDIQSRQVLEDVLASFTGTLLFVSHDRYFLNRLATKLWIIEDGGVTVFDDDYTAYKTAQGLKQKLQSPQGSTSSKQTKQSSEQIKPISGKQRSLECIEQDITASEQRIAQIESELADAGLQADADQLLLLSGNYTTAREKLEDLLLEWEEVASQPQ